MGSYVAVRAVCFFKSAPPPPKKKHPKIRCKCIISSYLYDFAELVKGGLTVTTVALGQALDGLIHTASSCRAARGRCVRGRTWGSNTFVLRTESGSLYEIMLIFSV